MKPDTQLVHLGRNPVAPEATVNVPVARASTIVSPDLKSYLNRFDNFRRYEKVTYGATGTHNAKALAAAISQIEGGYDTIVTSTGLSACTLAIGAVVKQGDHILVTDSVYGPTRRYCSEVLAKFGVDTEFYDPAIGADIAAKIRDNTTLIYTEAPGSLTFEMQDIPAITQVARERNVLVAMDNTWATPLYFKPLDHGVDISIQAGTKYVAGHSDLVIGLISTNNETLHRRVADYVMIQGDVASPDDCYLALRGLRTMSVRLTRQYACALDIAQWLQAQSQVKQVLYPPLETDPGHAMWAKDYTGGASLFGLTLHNDDIDAIARMVDGLEYFNIGSSWGGFESLIAVNKMPLERAVVPWTDTPYLLRLHIGLEDADDLMTDLDAGLKRLAG